MAGGFMRSVVATTVACLSIAGLSMAGEVNAASRENISIRAGGLGPALQTLSEKRRIHPIFFNEDVSKLNTQGAVGSLTTDEALNQLLDGTGLAYRNIDADSVSIVPIAAAAAALGPSEARMSQRTAP